MRFSRVAVPALLAILLMQAGLALAEEQPEELSGSMTSEHGFTVQYPGGWTVERYANLSRLYAASSEEKAQLDREALLRTTQVSIYTEQRTDHDEAVRRLREIELEWPVPATYLSIGGWPAVQRSYIRERPGGEGEDGPETHVRVVTTAIAVESLLVRLEAWLPEDAPEAMVERVKAVGQSLTALTQGEPSKVQREIDGLKQGRVPGRPVSLLPDAIPGPESRVQPDSGEPSEPVSPELLPVSDVLGRSVDAGASVRVTTDLGRDSELEIVASSDGRNVLIGTNNNWHISTDAGLTWNRSALGINGNDPSVAWGQSGGPNGTFYAANIESPSTGIRISTDGGANFNFQANAYTCGQGGDPACAAAFPDQEHIAADRFNVTATGDQVYSVWRHLDGNWGIVCSRDSGATWSTNGFFTGGDFPRVTVGQDGFVYVVYHNGANVMLSKFNSCENNQNPMVKAIGDRTVVGGISVVACPIPGHDRCRIGGFGRNTTSGPMVAVDDTDANHIYVAYGVNSSPGGAAFPTCNNQNTCDDDIIVQDSIDGGATWDATDPERIVSINSGVIARRFMPWVCAVGGTAYVSWFDRRSASPGGTTVSDNSLTDYYTASAARDVLGRLSAVDEFIVNDPGTADAQCEAGFPTGSAGSWPGAVDLTQDSETCSLQPQLGGSCCNQADVDGSGRCQGNIANSGNRCDFSSTPGVGTAPCLANEVCATGRGSPKYGDYNGNYCGAGRVYQTWASGTAPGSIAPSGDIDTFFSSKVVCCVPQITVPGDVDFGDVCDSSPQVETLHVCNTGEENLEIASITSSNSQFDVSTPTAGYPVTISPDFCFPFQLTFTPSGALGTQTTTLTVNNNDPVNPAQTVQASAFVGEPDISTVIADDGGFGDVCVGDFHDLDLTINNSGGCPLTVSGFTSSNSEFDTAQVMNPPLVIAPGDSLAVPVRYEPADFGASVATITIQSDDPDTPSKVVDVSGNTPPGDINVTGSTDFGDICAGALAEKEISVCNVGECNLEVLSASIDCADFTIINNPFPATVSPDFCMPLTVRFTPQTAGPKSCNLTITSDDPDTPVVIRVLTGNTPFPMIDVPPDQAFPPTVLQDVDVCNSMNPFPVSNVGVCPLVITDLSITDNTDEYSLLALPSFPIILGPGHVAGEGDLRTVFGPQILDRARQGEVSVSYISEPILGTVTTVPRNLCGEGVRTGARVLVTYNGVPLDEVKSIKLQRINANRNGTRLDTVDNVRDVLVQTVTPPAPCESFQFHREYSTVDNPIQLLPGSFQVTVQVRIDGRITRKTVGFDVSSCDFNPSIVVDFNNESATLLEGEGAPLTDTTPSSF